MSKTIEIKKIYFKYLLISYLLGFSVLYGLEHFGTFSYDHLYSQPSSDRLSLTYEVPSNTKVEHIRYETYFNNTIFTDGNGFDIYDLHYSDTDFNNYKTKSYYYTQATIEDYKYGIYLSIFLFIVSLIFINFKIKLT